MNKRTFIKTVGTGLAIAVVAPSTLFLSGCEAKDIAFYVDTITGALKQLSPLLPGAAGLISKAIAIAGDLKAAYEKGDFANTSAIFGSLSEVMSQIASDAGINSPSIKLIFAIAGVALNTIGAMLKAQVPQARMVSARVTATPAQQHGADLIEKAASSADAIFAAVRP